MKDDRKERRKDRQRIVGSAGNKGHGGRRRERQRETEIKYRREVRKEGESDAWKETVKHKERQSGWDARREKGSER